MTTSWKRFSDGPQRRGGAAGAQAPSVNLDETQQVATWENEGGHSALPADPLKILIVDDDIESSSSLELMLRALGHSQTRVAYSGHAALAIAADFEPSLVLLETALLDMSGDEVARILRRRAPGHDVRMIALTSRREHADPRLGDRVAGFERCLLKPVAASELAALLAGAVRPR